MFNKIIKLLLKNTKKYIYILLVILEVLRLIFFIR